MRGIEQIPWAYDLFMELAERTGLHRWRLHVVGEATGRTLDLGCGTGRNLPLFDSGLKVIGLELEIQLLRRARRRAPETAMVIGSAEALPFQAGCFDTVVSSLVFCTVREPAKGLAEIKRVLGTNGRLRMLEHVRSSWTAMARIQDLIQPVWTWIAGGCHPNRDTESEVERAGFVIAEHGIPGRTTLRCFEARPLRKGQDTR